MLLAESLLGTSSVAATYIEDVFSTYLYTGNGSTQTITNGIDLSGKGGLVWLKNRTGTYDHWLWDTARGAGYALKSSSTLASTNIGTTEGVSFSSTGFSFGNNINWNQSGTTAVSWTFRKQAKFFDVVTYTGNGANRTIAHNLGSTPGCIFVKRTDVAVDWAVYHRGTGAGRFNWGKLNTTAAFSPESTMWNDTAPTSTVFSVGTASNVNANNGTYVAYLFAHNAGGFGAAGTDNVITCGSFSTDGFNTADINLGWEPQWILVKRASGVEDWNLIDNTRGWVNRGTDGSLNTCELLIPNSTAAEKGAGSGSTRLGRPLATGFQFFGEASTGFIYIAIRRGPMKTPTSGTSVFGLSARTGTGANATVTGGQLADAILVKNRGSAVASLISARLTGSVTVDATRAGYLVTSSAAGEAEAGTTILQANPWDVMDGVEVGTTSTITNASSNTFINYIFRRAPGFFDVVCYTGTGANRTVSHNLGVAPELMITKKRSGPENWLVYNQTIGNTKFLQLQATDNAQTNATYWNNTSPTSSVFSLGTGSTNDNTATYVAYLFATVAGVSKVGTYTGTGTTKQIDCGFTGGARFVLIKRTDSTGDWYVWDSARGIVAGNDSYLLLNSTAAEVTNTDYVDTYSAGFEISSTAPAAINANGGSFIFLAVA